MKKFLLIMMLVGYSIFSFGVEIKEISSTFPNYQGVVTTNVPANEAYAKAKLWIAENFNSAKDVIQLDSPETGTIICKGVYNHYGSAGEMRAHMTFKIETKDNRFRYTITVNEIYTGNVDVSMYSTFINKPNKKFVVEFFDDFAKQVKKWAEGIANSGVNLDTDSDW